MSEENFYSDDEEYEEEDEIFGYECLGCNSTFGPEEVIESDPCPNCGGMCLSALIQ